MASRALILGTAGHIDHGKTALVRALTGTDTDRLPEEKSRGITIDIGFAHLDLDTPDGPGRLGIVDVPGHERFIRNMLAGAAGVDLALLVVAADDSVMPQTREHLAILGFLGVRTGVIALTKCDRVDADWIALVEDEVRTLVAGTFLEEAEIVRTSATAGDGIDVLRSALARSIADHPRTDFGRPFRMAVDRSFVKEGLGTVVTGTVRSGMVEVGASVAWHAHRAGPPPAVSVRGIQSHGASTDRVGAGARAALVLGGVHHEDIGRGHELAAPGYLEPSSWLTVHLSVVPESPWPVRHRARVRLHIGTAEIPARVALLEGTGLEPGAEDVVQLVTAQPVVAVAGQPFVLRAESPLVTLGGGRVLEPTARRRARRDAVGREVVRGLVCASARERVLAAVARRNTRDFSALDLARETGEAPAAAEAFAADLAVRGDVVEIIVPPQRTIRAARSTLDALEARVGRAVAAAHRAAPLESRIARSAIVQRLGGIEERVVEGIIDRELAAGRLVGDDRAVADAQFRPKLTDRQRTLATALSAAFERGAYGPPDAAQIARDHGAGDRDLKPALEICISRGDLVHIGGGTFLHQRWDTELRDRTRAALAAGEGLTMSELKELLQTSRKFAVPIGEYLDRIGVTRRVGDRRVLRDEPERAGS